MVIGAEATGDFPRILRFVELLFLEYQREGTRAHTIVAEDGNQSAGIDSARKKHSDGHVAHQVRQHRIAQDRGQLIRRRVPVPGCVVPTRPGKKTAADSSIRGCSPIRFLP